MKSRIRSIAIFFVQIKSVLFFGSYYDVKSVATFAHYGSFFPILSHY